MMSFSSITPSGTRSFATASGVPPARAIRSTSAASSGGSSRPDQPTIASTAPLRISLPSTSTPLIRVCAVNGTNVERVSISSRSRMPNRVLREDDDRATLGRLVGE